MVPGKKTVSPKTKEANNKICSVKGAVGFWDVVWNCSNERDHANVQ